MTYKTNKLITLKDGYDNLSREQLIEMLRSKDLEIRGFEKEAKVKAKLERKVSALEKKNSKLEQEVDQLNTVLSNSSMLMKETVESIRLLTINGAKLITNDFTLSVDDYSFQAENVCEMTLWTANQLHAATSRLHRYSSIINKSKSERNNRKHKSKRKPCKANDALFPLFKEDTSVADNEPTNSAEALTVAHTEEEATNYLVSEAVLSPTGHFISEGDVDGADKQRDDAKAPYKEISGAEFDKAIRDFSQGISKNVVDVANTTAETLSSLSKISAQSSMTKQQAQEISRKNQNNKAPRQMHVAGVIRAMPEDGSNQIECFCNKCHDKRLFTLSTLKRSKEILYGNGSSDVVKVISEVYTGQCEKCESVQEITPYVTDSCQFLTNPASNRRFVRQYQYSAESTVGSTVDSTVDSTCDNTSHTTDKADKYKETSSEAIVDSTVKSNANSNVVFNKRALDESKEMSLDKAWSECDFKQMDMLLEMDNSKYPLKHKAAALLRTVSSANVKTKIALDKFIYLPKDAPVAERAALCLETMTLGANSISQKAYLDNFICQFQNKLDKTQLHELKNIQRKAQYWSQKLFASAQKYSPDTLVRKCGAHKIVAENGVEYIHPAFYDAEAYGYMPVFNKCQATTGLLISMSVMLSQLSLPKNRVYKYFADNGLDLSKQQTINWLIGYARAYMHPAAMAIRDTILHHSDSVLMDETTLKVEMTDDYIDDYVKSMKVDGSICKKTPESGVRTSQIWNLVSSWTSKVQGAYFMLSPTRNHIVPLNLLKDASDKVRYLTTDGYRGYDAAINKLQESGKDIKRTACLTHLRRPLHQYLEDNGLLKFYNEYLLPHDSDFFADFNKNLEILQNLVHKGTLLLTPININLLTIYYHINALYAVDTVVVTKHKYNTKTAEFKRDLKEARQRYSSVILKGIYDVIYQSIRDYPELVEVRSGKYLKFKAKDNRPDGKILVSFLSCKDKVWHFIDNPEVELSESVCERVLRHGVLAKKAFYILRSTDGAEAFCDFLTIYNTCQLNKVSYLDYVSWLQANMNHRMSKMPPDPTMRALPSVKQCTIVDENGKKQTKKYSRYSKENHICYDKVDMTGLLPHDYARYMQEYNSKNGRYQDARKQYPIWEDDE